MFRYTKIAILVTALTSVCFLQCLCQYPHVGQAAAAAVLVIVFGADLNSIFHC